MNKKKIITISLIIFAAITILGLIIFLINQNNRKDESCLKTDNIVLNKMETMEDGYENDVKEGYEIATTLVFTRNIDTAKAIQALKPYMLYKDGVLSDEDYELDVRLGDKFATFMVTYPDNTTSNRAAQYHIIDAIDGVEFASANPGDLHSYTCVVEKQTCPKDFDINKIPLASSTVFYRNLSNAEFDLTYENSLDPNNKIFSESTIVSGNGNKHHAYANVRIVENICTDSYLESIKPEEAIVPTEEPELEVKEESNSNWFTNQFNKIKDSFNNGFNDFKTNFENSQSFKVITIAASSVIGIALLYVVFVIIRKVWRVVKD